MGGPGSGRWNYPSKKKTVEKFPRLLIKSLFINNKIPAFGSSAWSSSGLLNNQKFEIKQKEVKIHTESGNFYIRLESSNCNYGGKRWWFRCPGKDCTKRTAHLYKYQQFFVCRHCLNLSYKTRQLNYRDRMFEKSVKIAAKVGAQDFDEMERPKGMHHITYSKLHDTAFNAFMIGLPS
jgi:hypothetical protein